MDSHCRPTHGLGNWGPLLPLWLRIHFERVAWAAARAASIGDYFRAVAVCLGTVTSFVQMYTSPGQPAESVGWCQTSTTRHLTTACS